MPKRSMSDRAVAASLVRIQKAKRAARIMRRARGMGLMSHSPSKYGVRYVPSGTSEGIDAYGVDWKSATESQRAKRKADGYYGRGEYFGKLLGGLAGGALGARFGLGAAGRAVGSFLGDKAGDFIKGKLFGRGLYGGSGLYEGRGSYTSPHEGHSNSLIAGGMPNISFRGLNDETSGLTISHTEYVGDIFGPSSSGFVVQGYALNPGLQDQFPLLSQFAQNFEEYEFIQLVFHFRSVVDGSSTNNPDGNTGTIVMATDYASLPSNFSDKAQMVSMHGAVTGRQVDDVNHGIECDPRKNMGAAQKTVRTGLIPGRDISTLDLGRFQIAYSNTPASFQNRQIGELWVTYTVHLDKPKIFSAAAGNVSQYRGVNSDAAGVPVTTIKGANWLTHVQNSLDLRVDNQTSGSNAGVRIWFPASANGVYEIKFLAEGTLLTALGGPFNSGVPATSTYTYTGNVRGWQDMYAGAPIGTETASEIFWSTGNNVNTGYFCVILRVKVTAATAGVDNTVYITPLQTSTVNQFALEVTEITPFFAQSSARDVGLYQSSLGVVTAPI